MIHFQVGDYHFGEKYSESLLTKHRQMFQPDYLLFNAYNATLWNTIKNEKQDFFAELHHFKKILKKLFRFCNIVKNRVLENIGANISSVLYSKEKLVIADSSWNYEFAWDSVDCMLAYVGKSLSI